jgi:HAD superfamily hydrolase (TIGR01549 family)
LTIEAVIFDFCQTLVDSADGFRAAEKLVQEKIFADLALTDQDEFLANYRRIRQRYQEDLCFSRKDMWQEVYRCYCRGFDPKVLERRESEYWLQVSTTTVPFPEAKRVLQGLAGEYKLALITNTDARTDSAREQIDQFPQLKEFFSVIVLAGKGGVPPKPDRGAFAACLEELGVAAERAVYVGDDWRIDVCGASEAGIQPIWIQHRSAPRTYPNVETSAPIITSLEALLDLDSVLQSADCGL